MEDLRLRIYQRVNTMAYASREEAREGILGAICAGLVARR